MASSRTMDEDDLLPPALTSETCGLKLELVLQPTIQGSSEGAGFCDQPRHRHPAPGPELTLPGKRSTRFHHRGV
jgi:hypothetical protein